MARTVRAVPWWRRIVWAVAGFLPALAVVWFLVLPFLGRYLLLADGPCQADAVVVLAGDDSGARALVALGLLEHHYAPVAIVSGAHFIYEKPEAGWQRSLMLEHGAAPEAVIAWQHRAESTRQEAGLLVRELERRGIRKFILVTSNFHTRRASWTLRRTAGMPAFCTVPAEWTTYQPEQWWLKRESTEVVVFEWLRFGFAWFETYRPRF